MTDIFLRNLSETDDLLAQAQSAFHAGQLEMAHALCLKSLAAQPHHAESNNLLAAIAVQCGEPAAAIELLRQAVASEGTVREYHHNLGNVLKSAGRHEEAALSYRQALALDPQAVDSLYELAESLAELGRNDEAEAGFRSVITAAPEIGDGYYRLGILRLIGGANRLAITDFQRALVCQPDFPDAHTNLAIMLREEGRFDQALLSFRHAALLRPDDANIHANLGTLHRELGRRDDFSRSLDHAVALEPDQAEFHYTLAMGRSFAEGDRRLAGLEKLAEKLPQLDPNAQVKAHFALAKAYEDLGDHARSFQHQMPANRIKRAQISYDEAAALGHFARIKKNFSLDIMQRLGAVIPRPSVTRLGDPADLPIFVLGMPRSGSSLIEQILASHRQVFGAGELLDLPMLARALGPDSGPFFPEIVPQMAPDEFLQLGASYIHGLRARAPQAARIVDKLPDNFRLIGLIHLALPQARIIHTRRDPIDSCLSIYSKLFTADIPYSYDLREIGRYWRTYESVMAHWREVLPPGTIIDVDYEAMVDDQEAQTRRLLDLCGLEWDEACLQFHRTDRVVRTASALQVRRPLYNSSVGRWRPASDLLEPLMAGLQGR